MARAEALAERRRGAAPVVFDWKISAEARVRRRLQDELRQR